MRRLNRLSVLILGGVVMCAAQDAFAADPPPWLREAALSATPSLDRNVPALVLRHEERVTIEDDGRVLTGTSYAVRVLTRTGRSAAVAREVYRTDSGKVRNLQAWLIPGTGKPREFDKDEIVDVALVNDDVYNEARVKRIAAGDDAQPGSVFGYESLNEDRAIFSQFEFQFQSGLPALHSRFVLTVPNGWRVESVTFNHDPIRPVVSGSTYTWQLQDLPFIEDEPASPELSSLVARIAVSVFPPDSRSASWRTFASWQDVSRWLTELNDPQVILNDDLVAKAKQLTAGAGTNFERIAAIGKYVQAVQYISIQTGIGRGGGYRPHTSADVFAKAYGDCKDKANLMRAMLKAVGIASWPVAIYSGDPDYVRQEWPSPQQFNHAVIAVQLSESTTASSVLKHPELGSLMIFDPTDPETPVGELPDHEQGSFALIVAGERGGIARMPSTPSEANRLERTIDATLGGDGSIAVKVREQSVGHSATTERREFRALSRPDYEKAVESWVARTVSGVKLGSLSANDDETARTFTLQTEFAAPRYGQLMQNRLLVFKPAIVSRRASLFLTDGVRKLPIVLEARAYTETARIKLPAGFQVDELPDPVKLERAFGTYSANHTIENGDLVFTRMLTIRRSILPVDQYASVRSFYEQILSVEQAPAVLIRR